MRNYLRVTFLALLVTLLLAACGDNTNTPAPIATTTTAVTTTAASSKSTTTTAVSSASTTEVVASGDNSLGGVPPYPGATIVNLFDTVKNQFMTSVGSAVKNPQVGAFTTPDGGSQMKAFFTDYFSKNGWTDLSASAGAGTGSQIEQLGGFFLIYNKDKTVFAVIGLPGSAAAALGSGAASVPASGSLVMGFVGQAP